MMSQLQLHWQLLRGGTRYDQIFSRFVWQIYPVLAADLKHSTRRENLFGRKYLKMWSIFVSDSGGSCSCWYSVMTTISICHSWTTVRLRKCEQTITQAEDKGGPDWLENQMQIYWTAEEGREVWLSWSWEVKQTKIISHIISTKIKHWRQWRFMASRGFQHWKESSGDWTEQHRWSACKQHRPL